MEGHRGWAVVKRVLAGTWDDGFIYAGNIAYLSLLTLFPFFIVVATIAGTLGRTEDGLRAVNAFLETVPPNVADVLAKPIGDVISRRDSGLLTFSIVVGLWTVGSYIETMREIIRRAYNALAGRPIWQYRLGSTAIIFGSVILMLIAFTFQVVLTGAEQFIYRLLPFAVDVLGWIGLSRIAPLIGLFAALYGLFYTLTPQRYRKSCQKWPGAALTTVVWISATMLLPRVLAMLGNYDLTYGSLAGVIIALLFFFIVGLGFVVGAQLNAALAIVPKTVLKGDQNRTNGDE